MNKIIIILIALFISINSIAQINSSKGKVEIEEKGKGFYDEFIMKDVNALEEKTKEEEPFVQFIMDQSELDLPYDATLYKTVWCQPTQSQGNTGTCWCFSTSSFYESEIFRQTGKKVELSEIYTVYWEYVEKARRYIDQRGESLFDEGSEGNAVSRTMNIYGIVPASEYTGILGERKYHSHEQMMAEMKCFLESMKTSNAWNMTNGLETIKEIMNHYIGVPPVEFTVEGKKYTPLTYMKNYLKLDPNNFVEILSYKQELYWQQVEYKVPDNWWHSKDYYNVPLDDFMAAIKEAIKNGYTLSIGGDVSESGFSRETNCAIIPDYDIPSEYINEDARQFRFTNESTTDDHGMHLIGILENYKNSGKDWYLIKDSSSGSRNVGDEDEKFGYYFFHEDYIKLKMMGFTVHKDAVKELLKKVQ